MGKIKNEHLSITIVSQHTFQAVFLSLYLALPPPFAWPVASVSSHLPQIEDVRTTVEARNATRLCFMWFSFHLSTISFQLTVAQHSFFAFPFALYLYFGHHIMTLTLTCGNLMLMTLISSDTNKPGVAVAAPEVTSTPANPPSTCPLLLLHLTRF